MSCQHRDRPNVLSLPSLGNPHMCRECWDTNVQPKLDALPRPFPKGSEYEYHGPDIMGSDGKLYREQRLR